MSFPAAQALLVLLLALTLLQLLAALAQAPCAPLLTPRRPRSLRPRTPADCPLCQLTADAPLPVAPIIPYSQLKSRRGRKRSLDTAGYACPTPDCDYRQITDPEVDSSNLSPAIQNRIGTHNLRVSGSNPIFVSPKHRRLLQLAGGVFRLMNVLRRFAGAASSPGSPAGVDAQMDTLSVDVCWGSLGQLTMCIMHMIN